MFIISQNGIWNTDMAWRFFATSNCLTGKTMLKITGPEIEDGEADLLCEYRTEERAQEVLQEIGKALAYGLKAFMLPEE